MISNPKVTVLMSVYNGERFLQQAIDSILNQTYQDFEFLIIDDGSNDRSREIIQSHKDQRIRLIYNEENIGLTPSLNKGLELARGEYIARMDADDVSFPQRLEKQVEFLEHNPEVILLGAWAEVVDENGKIIKVWRYPTKDCVIRWRLLFGNCLVHSSVIYRKDKVLDAGGYNSSITYAQDYELWTKLSTIAQIRQLPQVLIRHRRFMPGSIGDKHLAEQTKAGEAVAHNYAMSILGDVDLVVFSDFYNKTQSSKLDLHSIRGMMGFSTNALFKFFKANDCNLSCRKEIIRDTRIWLLSWLKYNWWRPLISLYLIVSMIRAGGVGKNE
jgi:glycosyltransferase involved in cell wall biosynthesis